MTGRPATPRQRSARRRLTGLALLVALLVASGTTAQAWSVRVLGHGDRSRPLVALTFDDGISPANCRRSLAILVQLDAPATFFPFAAAMNLDPAFWRLVAATGDPVGAHTYSHPQMARLSFAAQLAEIDRGRRVAETIIGRSILPVFRPPYGAYNSTTLRAASQAGFGTVLLWDVSDRDSSPHGTIAQMRAAAELGRNGSIVLMHCGPNATPYLLADVIAFYRDRGFRFVTVPELLAIPWVPGPTRVLTPGEILGSLSPLPPSPSGGPITGPNGYSPSPANGPISEPPTSPSLPARVEPTSTSSPAATDARPEPSAVAVPEAGQGQAGVGADLTVVAVLVVLAILTAGVGLVALSSRFRRG